MSYRAFCIGCEVFSVVMRRDSLSLHERKTRAAQPALCLWNEWGFRILRRRLLSIFPGSISGEFCYPDATTHSSNHLFIHSTNGLECLLKNRHFERDGGYVHALHYCCQQRASNVLRDSSSRIQWIYYSIWERDAVRERPLAQAWGIGWRNWHVSAEMQTYLKLHVT